MLTGPEKEKLYAHACNIAVNGGANKLRELKKYYKTFETAWQHPISAWKRVTLIRKPEELELRRKHVDLKKEAEQIQKEEIQIVLAGDAEYPKPLTQILDYPEILYVKGNLQDTFPSAIGVVGTRRFSSYGAQVCEHVVEELTRAGLAIISGMAVGIDALAHKTCIANRGYTIAVLGSGVARGAIFPQFHQPLAREIVKTGGAVISEFPAAMKAERWTFPLRNRIIAGLSRGILVIEAPAKSGALITASCALEYNRDVFAIPGTIFSSKSEGANELIKAGAYPVTSPQDIFNAWNIVTKKKAIDETASEKEKLLLEMLDEPLTVDDLSKMLGSQSRTIAELVTTLELQGKLKTISGKIYKAASR